MNKSKTYVVYETTNLITNEKYIGCFSYKDGAKGKFLFTHYIGHGITHENQAHSFARAGKSDCFIDSVVEHGFENFARRDLFTTNDEDEAFAKEAELCDLDYINREDTLNRQTGGRKAKWSEASKQQRSKKISGKNNPFAKAVINHLTGEIIYTIKEAASKYNINYSTLRQQLRLNKHPFLTYSDSPFTYQTQVA